MRTNKIKLTSISGPEFKKLVTEMLTKLKRITKERSLKQGIGNYQDKQTKKLISEVKNNLEAMES